MHLKIRKVGGQGNIAKEVVMLKASQDILNLDFYAICDNTYKEGKISNKERHFFWLPDIEVKKGEYVAVWTKAGTQERYVDSPKNRVIHRVYWGLDQHVWNKDGDQVTLIHFDSWVTKTAIPPA